MGGLTQTLLGGQLWAPVKVFISHAWRGLENTDYHNMINLLNNAQFSWINTSVAQNSPLPFSGTQLENALQMRIQNSNVFVLILGMYLHHREMIQHELSVALQLRKPIVGVRPFAQERIPTDIENICNQVCGWNTNSIISAIQSVR